MKYGLLTSIQSLIIVNALGAILALIYVIFFYIYSIRKVCGIVLIVLIIIKYCTFKKKQFVYPFLSINLGKALVEIKI